MKRHVLTILLAVALFAVGWLGVRWSINFIRQQQGGAKQTTTADERTALIAAAINDYNQGKFSDALPKFEKYVSTLNIDTRNPNSADLENLKRAEAYIIDIKDQLASGKPPRPLEQSQLIARAQAIVQAQNSAPGSSAQAADADRVPHKPVPAGQIVTMTIKELGNFEFDPEKQKEADVPADIKAMEGSHLRLSGFMIPDSQAEQITHFALVPSLTSCCYGSPPGVQHVIVVNMVKGKTLDFTADELEVVGTLHVHVLRQDGYTYQIFEMTGEDAKVKAYVN